VAIDKKSVNYILAIMKDARKTICKRQFRAILSLAAKREISWIQAFTVLSFCKMLVVNNILLLSEDSRDFSLCSK